MADVVYNDLDDSVDAIAEQMTLQYDPVHHIAGPDATTRLAIDVDGKFVSGSTIDHNNCNIQGGSQYLVLAPHVTGSSVSLSFPDGLRFDDCSDVRRVVVTPVAVGTSQVSFTISDAKTPGDPRTSFDLGTATFDAVVNAADLSSSNGTGTKCDKNPAAPAWANALLQANGMRPRVSSNYVRQVADRMAKRASFPDANGVLVAKDADNRAYAKAVYAYMTGELGLSLPNGLDTVRRPGWVCTTVS